MSKTSYVVALGSNRRHHRYGAPRRVLVGAVASLGKIEGIKILATAPIIITAAVGPAGRSFANTALLLRSRKNPEELLAELKILERSFGRRRGRRSRER